MEKNTVAHIRPVSLLSVCLGSVLFLTSCSAGENKGLVACWRFDEGKGDKLLDTSGNGNHGKIHGAAWTKGRVGGGLRFDGVDDYVKVPKSASLNSAREEITLMCWIKTPLTGRHSILERWPCGESSQQRCMELDVDSEGKCVNFGLSPTGVYGTWHKRPESIQADKWVHIAATSDGQTMRVYINGEPDPSPSVRDAPQIHKSTSDLHIGGWYGSDKWDDPFKGTMDEIKIYSRPLTHEEILENYKAGSPIGTVAGRITAANGKPIEAAKVSVGPFLAATNRQGRYRIAVPAGTFDVNATKNRYEARAKSGIKVKTDETTTVNIILTPDETPPIISDVKTQDIDGVSVTVVWKTNEKCKGCLVYGTSTYGTSSAKCWKRDSISYVKAHRVTLTGLTGGVKYYFTVESTDSAGNVTKSKEYTLTTQKIDHPRLFLNKRTLPAIRARALGAEKVNYAKLKAWLDKAAANPPKSPSHHQLGVTNGYLLSGNAFVYLVSGDKVYLERARKLLEQTASYFRKCDREDRPVHWYIYSRINAIVAYDWLFNDLSTADRKRIGKMLLDHVESAQKPMPGKRRNAGNGKTGMYGTYALPWFVGLATYGEGIDDERAGRFLNLGYERHMKMLAWRREMAGDDGGAASASVNYAACNYPYVEFNFFHTMESAFSTDMPRQWPHVGMFVNWAMWNWIAGPDGPMEFGTGDAYHKHNRFETWAMYGHLAQIRHFCSRDVPDCAAMARWMQGQLPKDRQRYLLTGPFPWMPFLLTRIDKSPPAKPPSQLLPPARHFEAMGQIFMRSGSGPDDTYALFTAGSISSQHKHYDENNFVIYKKGHLAIDTGTRPEPGAHLYCYYCRTVAHNCILIHMPGEKPPGYWGTPAPGEGKPEKPNDGGMNIQIGAKVKAFETCKEFTYIASDATPCYNEKKCALALRQFVFVPPNHFVILDRVTSVKPEYKKTFLLHAPVEPKIEGDTFSWAYEGGRLLCRTLLPSKAKITKIGGPGKRFWCDGRNWPLTPNYRVKETNPLLGQWRVEVSPSQPQTDDFFLHLIEVGDRKVLTRMCASKLLRDGKDAGVEFQAGERRVTVMFTTDGPPGGFIRITDAGKTIERNFTNKVQKQVGLIGLPPKK